MEASALLPSRSLMSLASSASRPRRQRRVGGMAIVRAIGGREHRWGRLVDENMIVLRLRIREMKIMEKKNEKEEEDDDDDKGMMEWERKYYVGEYGEHVCEVVGLLQSYLMSVRPCFAMAMMLLVALSVFISSGLFLLNSINTMKALFSSVFLF
ncbi:uncharacterized protein LOC129289380 [Prosopis cineraria]|uniref:uncharacterized protein LOC129289380 n=1 Tax=Prosopis cineraria TaxID=364024 RepID=UPI00240F0FAB|nr:uncharacterized protein LOC129289380 [Prosopis cineraria]